MHDVSDGNERDPDESEHTTELRISVPTAAVAAGKEHSNDEPTDAPVRRLVGRSLDEQRSESPIDDAEPRTGSFSLPDWSDPPTGLVPRVLLDEEESEGEVGEFVDAGLRGPSWREAGADWTDDSLDFLLDDEADDTGATEGAAPAAEAGDAADIVVPESPPSGRGRRRRAHGRHEAAPRSVIVSTIVGIAVGAVALACFHFGPQASVALVCVAVTLAAAELFSSLQHAGYRPATLIGLVSVPLFVLGAYLHGPIAIPFVVALLMVGFAIWGVAGLAHKDPIVNLSVTALVVTWTGILGAFAGLLLNPVSFPHRHGVAYLVGAVVLTVAHDVGSYAVGARLGRHHIAPRVSPGKTREGLIGGSLLTLIVAFAIVSHIRPYSLESAFVLGLFVVVFAPLGDLFESVAKRDLGLKDMGRVLPGHGGVFDRIDAMLFVIPACYLALRLLGKN